MMCRACQHSCSAHWRISTCCRRTFRSTCQTSWDSSWCESSAERPAAKGLIGPSSCSENQADAAKQLPQDLEEAIRLHVLQVNEMELSTPVHMLAAGQARAHGSLTAVGLTRLQSTLDDKDCSVINQLVDCDKVESNFTGLYVQSPSDRAGVAASIQT